MKVISNTAISLDGRINTIEGTFTLLGTSVDHQKMQHIRRLADAVLVGGQTFRNWPYPSISDRPDDQGAIWNVVVSRSGDIPLLPDFVNEPRTRKLLLLDRQPRPPSVPAEIEVEVYQGPLPHAPISWMMECLAERGVKNLLVEAGGELLSQFVAADALDELYVTLCPVLIGGKTTPGLVGGLGFSLLQMPRLTLLSSEVVGDEIFLHYRVNREAKTAKS